jgi:hypothetical protein
MNVVTVREYKQAAIFKFGLKLEKEGVDGQAVKEGSKAAALARPHSIEDRCQADAAFKENNVACRAIDEFA